MSDKRASASVTQLEAEGLVDARVSPLGSLENLSQREVQELLTSGQGGVYEIFRRCALAVLTSGLESDDVRAIFERYKDFEVRFGRQAWGVKLELKNAPASAFVDGQMIRGIKEHLFAVLRDIIYVHDAILGNRRFDLSDPASITNAVYHILRNARILDYRGKPDLVVCWGGHSIGSAEYDYTKRVGYELGLRALSVCTGCGPGAMKGPMNERADEWAPLEVLSKSVLKWDVSTYSVNPESCSQLADLVGNASEQSARIFRDAFPAMVDFFVERPEKPQRAFISIYSMLIKVIAWSGAVSADELEISTSLARALLSTGPDEALYTECLQDLQEIIAANGAPVHLDWALSLGELLAFYPAQGRELRLRVFFGIFEMCRAAAHRLTAEQRAVLELLAADYSTAELLSGLPVAARNAEDTRVEFAGVIGIYTLNEPAGQRAREVIERLLPAARVELNHATAATDRLRQLAKSADLFVFAWKTSTHQAFYCVKEARKDRHVIMPSGGGTASLVRSVLDQVRSLQQVHAKDLRQAPV